MQQLWQSMLDDNVTPTDKMLYYAWYVQHHTAKALVGTPHQALSFQRLDDT
jgi:hypothetical protein